MFGVTDELIAFLKEQEGFVPHPYLDAAKKPTIGYGHLLQSMDHPNVTMEEAEALLRSDVANAANDMEKLSPNLLKQSERRASAIIDFIFNLGAGNYQSSTLRKFITKEDWQNAAMEIQKWVWAGSGKDKRKLSELIARRKIEAEWLLEG